MLIMLHLATLLNIQSTHNIGNPIFVHVITLVL